MKNIKCVGVRAIKSLFEAKLVQSNLFQNIYHLFINLFILARY